MLTIPESVNNIRVIPGADGSFSIPRKDAKAEKFLDSEYVRYPNTLRWHIRYKEGKKIPDLLPTFEGRNCYIIGKGPSLDALTDAAFTNDDSPIIALNESVHTIDRIIEQRDTHFNHPVFSLQFDGGLKDTCKSQYGDIFIMYIAKNWYANIKNKYLFYPSDFCLTNGSLSVECAIAIAKSLKVKKFFFYCFDGCTGGSLEYSKSIPYKSTRGGEPGRFRNHKRKIEKACKGVPMEWKVI